MVLKSILYGGVLALFLSFTLFPKSENLIWSGSGDATQDIFLNKIQNKKEPSFTISYSFKNVRYGSIIDTGSFTLNTQSELNQLIIDLNDAIENIGVEDKIVWKRSKYTLSAGGIAPLKKGHFRIEIGEVFCPIHKKDAKKLIKVLVPQVNLLPEK
tara:strand:+ start:160 stop:627 length:468 start_codon:yes stop_codon:yes gene_type:complete